MKKIFFIRAAWTFSPVLLALILWLFVQKENKSLSVTINSYTTIASVGNNKTDDIELIYKGLSINAISAVDISITNNGNTPIKTDDFYSPLIISAKAQIASEPTILSTSPNGISPKFIFHNNTIELIPLLLNKGDTIKIRLIILDAPNENSLINAHARIVGVENVILLNNTVADKYKQESPILSLKIYSKNIWSVLIIFAILCLGIYIFIYNTTHYISRKIQTKKLQRQQASSPQEYK